MFDKQTYIARRKALHAKLSGGLVLLPGNDESPANYPGNTFRFRQDSTFLYFFGLNRPGCSGLLDLDSGEDVLFGDDRPSKTLSGRGPQPSLAELAGEVGVEKTQSAAHLQKRIEAAVAKGAASSSCRRIAAKPRSTMSRLLGIRADRLASYASAELARAVVALREVKEPAEIEEIERALRDRRQNAPPGDAHMPSGDYRTRNRRGDRRRRPATRSRSIVPGDRNAARRNAA